MKKVFLLLALISFVAFSTTSCKKCVTCTYKYKYLDDTITVPFPENCSKKKDQDAFKAAATAEAQRHDAELICVKSAL